MTQKEVDAVLAVCTTIHTERDYFDKVSLEDVINFVATNLSIAAEVHTVPVGSHWGILTDKSTHLRYYNKRHKNK